MIYNSLTLYLTEECNFDCTYCYQKKRKNSLRWGEVHSLLERGWPFFSDPLKVNFYGGEPLIEFPLLRKTVSYLFEKRNPQRTVEFTLTTNGSLLDKDILSFLNEYRFKLHISFDGLAQEITRKGDTFSPLSRTLRALERFAEMDVQTVSIFTPATVPLLHESIQYIKKLGRFGMFFSFSFHQEWNNTVLDILRDQMGRVVELAVHITKTEGKNPILPLRPLTVGGLPVCKGGQEGFVLTPGGEIWGCDLLFDYAKRFRGGIRKKVHDLFCLGDVGDFFHSDDLADSGKLRNYRQLAKTHCRTDKQACLCCQDLMKCVSCPVTASFFSPRLGYIPDWVCEILKINMRARENFRERVRSS